MHRQKFTPITPTVLSSCTEKKVTLKEDTYPIDEGLHPLFPTLIGKGMKYFELNFDEEKG